ncbi:MAG: alpha/beta hydrolase [Gelidibacter sp.]
MILYYKNIPIHFTEHGVGDTIVLLHGFLENSTMWKDLIPQISRRHHVLAIDLLGHGNTGCLGYIHTMEEMSEAVNFVLEHLSIKEATFIGHSMGGYVALAFAELYPKKIRGLCLMNSTSMADTQEKRNNRDRAIKAVKQNHQTFISMSVSNLFAPNNRERLIKEIEEVKKEALKIPVQGIVAALEGMKIRKNREFILHHNNFKKMMIIGQKDPVLNYESLIHQTKGTDVKIIEFSDGHMSHIENNKELSYNIMLFIEK